MLFCHYECTALCTVAATTKICEKSLFACVESTETSRNKIDEHSFQRYVDEIQKEFDLKIGYIREQPNSYDPLKRFNRRRNRKIASNEVGAKKREERGRGRKRRMNKEDKRGEGKRAEKRDKKKREENGGEVRGTQDHRGLDKRNSSRVICVQPAPTHQFTGARAGKRGEIGELQVTETEREEERTVTRSRERNSDPPPWLASL